MQIFDSGFTFPRRLSREEVVLFLSLSHAKIFEHEFILPLGESSFSEERANPVC
jgi:hypothetical protein